MEEAPIALVVVSLLAGLIEDHSRLEQALDGFPDVPEWQEVRQVVEHEIRTRKERLRGVTPPEEVAQSVA